MGQPSRTPRNSIRNGGRTRSPPWREFFPDRDDQWRQRRADIDSGIPSAQPKAIEFKELFLAQEEDDEESASLADVLAGMAAKQWTNSARGNVQPQANDIAKLINNPGSDYLAEADQQLAVTLREFLRAVQRSLLWWHGPGESEMPHTDANRPVIANWWFPRRGAI